MVAPVGQRKALCGVLVTDEIVRCRYLGVGVGPGVFQVLDRGLFEMSMGLNCEGNQEFKTGALKWVELTTLAVERRPDHLYFFDLDDPALFSATIRWLEEPEVFEVNTGIADLDDGLVASFSYAAPALVEAFREQMDEHYGQEEEE